MELRRDAFERWRGGTCVALVLVLGMLTTPTGSAQPAPVATSTASATPTPTPTPPAIFTATATPTPTLVATPSPTPVPTPFSSGVPCATDDPSNERVQRSERHGIEDDQGNRANQDNGDEFRTGNGRNEVVLHNCTNDRLRVRAAIQLNTIAGRVVKPLNEAYAEGSCTHCQTLVVALQVDLYDERATDIEPQNYAIAINNDCQHCVTVALAIQYAQ